jgi:hypothetical protein
MASIREEMCGAKRQGRIRLKGLGPNLQILLLRCIVEIDKAE